MVPPIKLRSARVFAVIEEGKRKMLETPGFSL
jgi:hypothetical protein